VCVFEIYTYFYVVGKNFCNLRLFAIYGPGSNVHHQRSQKVFSGKFQIMSLKNAEYLLVFLMREKSVRAVQSMNINGKKKHRSQRILPHFGLTLLPTSELLLRI
jgi:hypothetical protein